MRWQRPVRSFISLFRSPVFVLGCAVDATSWGFHIAALTLAPISVVQAITAGGLVLITVLGDRVFGQVVSRREWIGVALTAVGLAFLAATLQGTVDAAHSDYREPVLAAMLIASTAAALLLIARGRTGPALAVAAGLLWAGADITIKALSDHGGLGFGVLGHPFIPLIAVWSLAGLLVSARSLQLGPVVPVASLTAASANTLIIASGPTVFGEPLPEDPAALLVRLSAFALVITAAAMTPPPMAEREAPA